MATLESITKVRTVKVAAKVSNAAPSNFDSSKIGAKVELSTKWRIGAKRANLSGAVDGAGSPWVDLYVDSLSDMISTVDASGLTVKAESMGEIEEYEGRGGVTKFRRRLVVPASDTDGKIEVAISNVTDREALARVKTIAFKSIR